MSNIILNHIDPTLFKIGSFEIRWYSLAYISGIILGWLVISYFNKIGEKKVFKDKKFADDFFVYAVLALILGGRLGYVLFYNFGYYLTHPLRIFYLWEGGMSFHGGFIGAGIAAYLICKKHKVDFWRFSDLCSIMAPIGLFLGRIANFVNMELYGRTTEVPWGVVFPNGGNLPRHPSQLYEALFEGFLLFLILFCLAKYTKIRDKIGCLTGIFLSGYSVSRIVVECFREPDIHIGYVFNFVTMGQILTVPILFLGLYLIIRSRKIVES